MTLLKRMAVLAGVGVFFIAVFAGYRLSLPTAPQEKPRDLITKQASSEAQPYEVIFQAGYGICYEHHLNCLTASEGADLSPKQNLPHLTLEQIGALYTSPEWAVLEEGRQVYLTKLAAGLCPDHRQTLHLGANSTGEYLAIYYGPSIVGDGGGVYRVTDIAMASLDEGQKEKIHQGYFELYSQDELFGLLDSFSELE